MARGKRMPPLVQICQNGQIWIGQGDKGTQLAGQRTVLNMDGQVLSFFTKKSDVNGKSGKCLFCAGAAHAAVDQCRLTVSCNNRNSVYGVRAEASPRAR
jgi:hypothetical protein